CMMPRIRFWQLIAAALAAIAVILLLRPHAADAPNEPASAYGGQRVWLGAPGGRTKALVFRGANVSEHPDLIIVLHGDAPSERPGYHYRFAADIAEALPNTIVVGLLRPGYTDPVGDHSDGEHGLTTGDNYTPAVVAQLAAAIAQLQAQLHPARTTLVGHS